MKNSPINVVETRDLTKRFGDLLAVDGLNLTIRQGEMFGLVGPDGAGKTTTIRMLCGVLLPSSGGARILERDLAGEADRIKEEIGYLSQRFSLYGDLSVDENIEFFAEIHGVYDYKSRREELLEFTRLAPFRKRLAERLSGGMKPQDHLSG
jgi:ABC-2 type transport system ATP-binding protein